MKIIRNSQFWLSVFFSHGIFCWAMCRHCVTNATRCAWILNYHFNISPSTMPEPAWAHILKKFFFFTNFIERLTKRTWIKILLSGDIYKTFGSHNKSLLRAHVAINYSISFLKLQSIKVKLNKKNFSEYLMAWIVLWCWVHCQWYLSSLIEFISVFILNLNRETKCI